LQHSLELQKTCEPISTFLHKRGNPKTDVFRALAAELRRSCGKGKPQNLRAYMDYITVFDEAREEGYEEGRKEGRAEAREKFTKSIILKMLKKAMPLAEIADLSDTGEAKIREIAKENGIKCQA
jgi:flagellar biosynthesis/type III secretory pathway protein FliH